MIQHDQELFALANMFLFKMYRMRSMELGRMLVLFRSNADIYMQPLVDYHVKMGNLDKHAEHKFLKWDDASITVAYFDYVLRRLNKYGLLNGTLNRGKFPNYKETLNNEEDKLVDYFLYEMRKEPTEEAKIPPMPFN
jgi:hypothetical protein